MQIFLFLIIPVLSIISIKFLTPAYWLLIILKLIVCLKNIDKDTQKHDY